MKITTTSTTTTVPAGAEVAIRSVSAERLAHSWLEGCPIGPDDLRVVTVTYRGFDGSAHRGDLIVHADHAEPIAAVFAELFRDGYPIWSVIPIGDLPIGSEDEPGYANTSAFNCRFVDGTTNWSEHARGMAIDINVRENPFVKDVTVWPLDAGRYVDRGLREPGMIMPDDAVVRAFESIGWSWGGYWSTMKDYQHFSATGR